MDKQTQTTLERICAERNIAWLVTDRNLRIIESGGVTSLVAPVTTSLQRKLLLKVLPTMQPYVEALKSLVTGRESRLAISRLERDDSDDAISVVALPARDGRSSVSGVLLIFDAVDEHSTVDAGESDGEEELQSGFVSVAAQALRSPLTVASLYLQMIEGGMYGEISPQLKENLDKIGGALNRLTVISKNLQDAARIDAGQLSLALQPVDLKQVVQSVVENVSADFEEKHHLISVKFGPGLPYISGDVTRIHQVVTNLLTNACKYTPEQGRITVSARKFKQNFIQIAVTDSGIGVAPEEQDRLFRRFFRTPTALESGEPGAGLGLYITRAIVELHGGEIWFEVNEDAGMTFYVTLPIATI